MSRNGVLKINSNKSVFIPSNMKFSDLIEAITILEGKPFRLNETNPNPGLPPYTRNYLLPIYNNFYEELVLMFGRQSEKSTTCANIMTGTCFLNPYYKWMFVSASLKQVSEFSRDKLDSRILESPILYNWFYNKNNWSVSDKYLKNGGQIKLRGMFRGPDRTRGASVDGLIFDEVQDIIHDDMYVAYETHSHSKHPEKRKIFAGTPKTLTNTLEQLRKKSKFFDRYFICEHCNYSQSIQMENIGPKYLICSKCGKDLRFSKQVWVKVFDKSDIRYSFRIPQAVVPWVLNNPKEWEKFYRDSKDMAPRLFMNEKMALPYGQADQPVSEEMLKKCCDENFVFQSPGRFDKTVMGIDYGRGSKSFTVVSIVAFINNRPTLIFAKKFIGKEANSVVYLEEIKKLYREYKVSVIGADAGDGFHQNNELKHFLGQRNVWVFEASGNLNSEVKWNENSGNIIFSRTKQLDRRFAEIATQKVKFPKWSVFETFGRDILNIYSEESKSGRIIFDHDEDSPDDFAHSWNYALMAGEILRRWTSPIKVDNSQEYILKRMAK